MYCIYSPLPSFCLIDILICYNPKTYKQVESRSGKHVCFKEERAQEFFRTAAGRLYGGRVRGVAIFQWRVIVLRHSILGFVGSNTSKYFGNTSIIAFCVSCNIMPCRGRWHGCVRVVAVVHHNLSVDARWHGCTTTGIVINVCVVGNIKHAVDVHLLAKGVLLPLRSSSVAATPPAAVLRERSLSAAFFVPRAPKQTANKHCNKHKCSYDNANR